MERAEPFAHPSDLWIQVGVFALCKHGLIWSKVLPSEGTRAASNIDRRIALLVAVVEVHVGIRRLTGRWSNFLNGLVGYLHATLNRIELDAVPQGSLGWRTVQYRFHFRRAASGALPEPLGGTAAIANRGRHIPRDGRQEFYRLNQIGLPRSVGADQDIERAQVEWRGVWRERKQAT